jgi:hypothetical protein
VDDNKNEKGKVDRTIIKREEGINIKEEEDSDVKTNTAVNNNDNDNDDDVDDDYGYESWTEGNWCLLLPSTSTVDDDENKNTTRRVRSNSRRRRQRHHRNRSISSSISLGVGGDDTDEDEYDDNDDDISLGVGDDDTDEDEYDDNDDDMIDERTRTKTTGKRSMKYKNIAYNKIWHEMFRQLVAYKKQHGSTSVPRSYKKDPKLGIWVNTQRASYNKKELSEERINLLESICFVWKMRVILPWDDMFQKLVAYKKQHKSTNVPRIFKEDPKLGLWVITQRTDYNTNYLSIKRINHFESICFIWDPHGAQWMEMYNQLIAYKKKYNSTIVPRKYKTDQKLATWVHFQRHTYNKGSLLEKRWELLNSINFVWSAKKASS